MIIVAEASSCSEEFRDRFRKFVLGISMELFHGMFPSNPFLELGISWMEYGYQFTRLICGFNPPIGGFSPLNILFGQFTRRNGEFDWKPPVICWNFA